MAVTEKLYTGNGSTTNYSFTFPYLKTTDIKASINGTATTAFTLANATTVQFNTAPANSAAIRIFRETDDTNLQATFYAGSAIKSSDLNDNFTQTLYVSQESNNKIDAAWTSGDETIDSTETWVSNDSRVSTTAAQDARIDSKIDTALTGDVVAGNKITVTDNSPGSGQITVAVTSGSLVDSDVNASAAIAGTKINPNFGSQNIVTSGTVDGRDVSTDGSKLDGIEAGATADQTNAEIRAAVEAASDSNVFTDADHSKLNAIEASATADQTAAEIRTLVESASDSNVFTDADHTKLNSIEDSATADQTISEIKSLIAGSPLDASHLAANSVTTSEIADSELTTLAGMQSGTASTLASATALSASTAEINNICDGMGYETAGAGLTTTDTKYATSNAVISYVAAQIAPLGGLEVVATEVAFPNTLPASGVVISISDAGGVVINGSGVSTTGRTVGGSTVTINGFPSSLQGETLAAGVGLMVSSTGSSQTYNYHKILGKEDDIKQLSDDINDFAERYRVGSSNPTSSLDDGDLFFNTGTGKMLVYNANNSAWEEVQSVGNFFINTISSYSGTGGNSATFNGSAYRFVLSNAPTNAEQLLVSVNGVIQKPNAGTSQPSEGFALDGSSIIFSSAPPSGSDYFIITIGSTVNIGTPSNNTVSTAIIQNLAVTGDKIATNLDLADNKKIRFGTGNDLEIFHNGSNSKIDNSTGTLYIQGDTVSLAGGGGSENLAVFTKNGANELYFDNSKKLETTSSGAQVTGNLRVDGQCDLYDDKRIRLGDSADLQIYHNGSSSYISNSTGNLILESDSYIWLGSKTGSETYIKGIKDGAVELYHNNVKKFETASHGCNFLDAVIFDNDETAGRDVGWYSQHDYMRWEDNTKAVFGSGADLQIYHDGSSSYVNNTNASAHLVIQSAKGVHIKHDGENMIKGIADEGVELYYDNVKKFETTSTGTKITGQSVIDGDVQWNGSDGSWGAFWDKSANIVSFKDGKKIGLGTSNDLQIYHDGTDSIIKAAGSATPIKIQGHSSNASTVHISARADKETIKCLNNSNAPYVELYYDGSKKLETTSSGITVTGSVTTNDINMSNLNALPNEVDGTKGSWTMQEGADDLFLINRSNGKKYKFNLTEVS